ncbi:MAG: PH domain-containing protein [Methanomassiliicoccus sp.]|nr:PH domain-containing protein [Methanomassiliicoccus sp.]
MNSTNQPTRVNRSKFSTKRLVSGESILWEGRPSVIVYFLRSLLLFIFGAVFTAAALIQKGLEVDFGDLSSYILVLLMVVLIILMFVVHRKWGTFQALAGIAVLILSLVDVSRTEAFFFAPLLIGLVALLVEYLIWSHTYFAISDRRIMTQTGIFSLLFVDTQIDRIQNVSVSQPFVERVLGYGDLMFATAGEMGGIKSDSGPSGMKAGGAIVWENVPKPFEVRKIAEDIIFRANRGTTYAPAYPQYVPAPAVSIEAEERLTKLKELRDKQLISQEEYDIKRKEILGRM